jgi:hypothetical protein
LQCGIGERQGRGWLGGERRRRGRGVEGGAIVGEGHAPGHPLEGPGQGQGLGQGGVFGSSIFENMVIDRDIQLLRFWIEICKGRDKKWKEREGNGGEKRRGEKSNEKEGVRNDEGKEGRGEGRGEERRLLITRNHTRAFQRNNENIYNIKIMTIRIIRIKWTENKDIKYNIPHLYATKIKKRF